MSFVRYNLRSWRIRTQLKLQSSSVVKDSITPAVSNEYKHLEVESKWQQIWDKNEVFKSIRRPGHKKKYVLDMFPYPSGAGLHVGHPEGILVNMMPIFYLDCVRIQ